MIRFLVASAVACLLALPASASGLPDGFTHLRDIAPAVKQDMRYAGSDNFVGRPIDGYE